MKRLLVGFIAGVVFASASIAGASSYLFLHKHQVVFYGQIGCAAENHGVLFCLKNKQGYNVGYSREKVYVIRGQRFVWHS